MTYNYFGSSNDVLYILYKVTINKVTKLLKLNKPFWTKYRKK